MKKDIEKITVQEAISKILKEVLPHLPNKERDAMYIMEHILKLNEAGILNSLNKQLKKEQIQKLDKIIKRIKTEEPLEYITGVSHFYGHRFHITPDVMIPRVETEILIDLASGKLHEILMKSDRKKPVVIADIGTGSGCIAISLLKSHSRDNIKALAIDISKNALKITEKNIQEHKLEKKILAVSGNLLDPISKFPDIIVANLPYIPAKELKILPKSVKDFEPMLALDGGETGLKLFEELLNQIATEKESSTEWKPIMLFELQESNIEDAENLARKTLPEAKTQILPDQFDKQRFLTIENN